MVELDVGLFILILDEDFVAEFDAGSKAPVPRSNLYGSCGPIKNSFLLILTRIGEGFEGCFLRVNV